MDAVKFITPDGQENYMGPPMLDVSAVKRKLLDVAYSDVSPRNKLDIYLPDQGDGPFPAIVYIHGGAFLGGDKRDMQFIYVIDGIRRGYAVISVEQRLAPDTKYPYPLFDFKAAIRFLRKNAAKYHLNPDRFAAGGDSAGGFYTMMAAATQDIRAFEGPEELGNMDTSSAVQAVLGLFGTYDLAMQSRFSDVQPVPEGMPKLNFVDILVGADTVKTPELLYFLDPKTFVTTSFPPALIQAGASDEVVPHENSIELAERINAVCGQGRAELDIFPDCTHGAPRFNEPDNIDRIFRFFDANLK